ncbi:MAG: hypothetical protein ACM3MD_00340 [Betaproteobacteria bacterium]
MAKVFFVRYGRTIQREEHIQGFTLQEGRGVFQAAARVQRPEVLFIARAASRVAPNLVTRSRSGELLIRVP